MTVTNYLWDPFTDNVIMETDAVGNVTASYTTEPELHGNLISQHRDGETSVYHFDGQGNTVALTNSDGDVTDTYAYNAAGETTESTGTTVNPYRFGGQKGYQYDSETSNYYVRQRLYEPTTSRWQSPDPLGFVDGMNLYSYVGNNPVNNIDPSGTSANAYSNADVSTCKSILKSIKNVWNKTNPCAAELLNGFLTGRVNPCPIKCRDTLRRREFDYIESCIKNLIVGNARLSLLLGGDGIGECGRSQNFRFKLTGSHDFQGSGLGDFMRGFIGLEGDLGFAFGHMNWDAQLSCTATCGATGGTGCCSCSARCGYNLTVTDFYDFCSTVPGGLGKFHPLNCACLLEEKGIGTTYNVKCVLPVYGRPKFNNYQVCCRPRQINPNVKCPCNGSA